MEAVTRHYWYEFFADELPIWGFVGPPPEQTKGDSTVYIYTHKTFDIAYNGDRVGAESSACSVVCLWLAQAGSSSGSSGGSGGAVMHALPTAADAVASVRAWCACPLSVLLPTWQCCFPPAAP